MMPLIGKLLRCAAHDITWNVHGWHIMSSMHIPHEHVCTACVLWQSQIIGLVISALIFDLISVYTSGDRWCVVAIMHGNNSIHPNILVSLYQTIEDIYLAFWACTITLLGPFEKWGQKIIIWILKECCYGNGNLLSNANGPSNHHTKIEIFLSYCWFYKNFPYICMMIGSDIATDCCTNLYGKTLQDFF